MENHGILVQPFIFEGDKGNKIEISIHICSRFLKREIQHVFQSIDLDGLIILPTMQKAQMDLVNVGEEVDIEKDMLLENFMEFARSFCDAIRSNGYWADYIDPCSGLPMMSPDCNKVYSEVAGAEILLKYRVQNANCCKILLHPTYGSHVYPASIFTTAPVSVTTEILFQITKINPSDILPNTLTEK